MNILLIAGNDKLGRRLVHRLGNRTGVAVVFDCSSNFRRVFRLIQRGALSLKTVCMMGVAELRRSDSVVQSAGSIASNQQLLDLIREINPEEIYLFRAGLIISRKVIETGIPIHNVHCARIPQYGGLGSLQRALDDGAYQQEATLHRVTEKIDEGEVLATNPYELDPKASFFRNEEVAYEAGIALLTDFLRNHR